MLPYLLFHDCTAPRLYVSGKILPSRAKLSSAATPQLSLEKLWEDAEPEDLPGFSIGGHFL